MRWSHTSVTFFLGEMKLKFIYNKVILVWNRLTGLNSWNGSNQHNLDIKINQNPTYNTNHHSNYADPTRLTDSISHKFLPIGILFWFWFCCRLTAIITRNGKLGLHPRRDRSWMHGWKWWWMITHLKFNLTCMLSRPATSELRCILFILFCLCNLSL